MKWFFKIFFRTLRMILTPFILLWDWLTTPKGIERSTLEQKKIDQQTKNLFLYQFSSCPFCIKVRREMKRLSLNIETRDAQHNQAYREELLKGGGEIKVPCLKIVNEQGAVTWMYESADIISYLRERFAVSAV